MQFIVARSFDDGALGIMIIPPRFVGEKDRNRAFEFVVDELVDDGPDSNVV